MSVVKTPTSSLTASQLVVNKLWYRTSAKIKWLLYGGAPEAPTDRSSPITKLPQDLVEVIISYFIYNTPTLLACSMTCYSWYIATVPHLHYSITTGEGDIHPRNGNYRWLRPFKKSYELGLLPFVKRFRIRQNLGYSGNGVTPKRLGRRTLRYFSALTNLQELGIDDFQVSSFMPNIRQCFGHFSPTLRFLALREPRGSCRQILYFIGLFPNLQHLKLRCYHSAIEQESTADATLVPLSAPPLRGWLTLTCFTRVNLIKDMITLFGGLRFRRMDLFRVRCVRLLLDACTETLETLRLYPTDPYANNRALLRDFNLSRNKSLQTLETIGESIGAAEGTASDFLMTVLSSVTSPVPVDVIIYQDIDFGVSSSHSPYNSIPIRFCYSPLKGKRDPWRYQQHLEVSHKVHNVRGFRLVHCADVSDCIVERAIKALERFVKAGKMKGGLSHSSYEPLIISERRLLRTRTSDYLAG